MNNVQRVSRALLLWLLIFGGIWAGSPVSALDEGLFIDNVVPGQVVPGQPFRIHGSFTGVTSAGAYLSDGIWGLPLDVLEVTDQYIEARVEAIAWPMTGTLHVLVHDDLVVLPDFIWSGPGFDIQVIGATRSTVTRAVSGGVLTVTGAPPPQPPNIAAAGDGGLTFEPDDPCGPFTTALVLIEPDLGGTPPGIPPPPHCVAGLSDELPMVFPVNSPAMTEQAFYTLLVQGLNQFWANNDVTVTYDPIGGVNGDGIIVIDQPGCPTNSGAAALICK